MADGDSNPNSTPDNNPWKVLLNPVVVIAWLILGGVLFLLFTAIMGWDKGHVLADMAKVEYARGLITYLFAVVTVGTAVLLVVFVLMGTKDDTHKEQFDHGKEILSLLLGVFGTIVGFYFGAEVAKGAQQILKVASIHVSAPTVDANAKFKIETVVTGGVAPYSYGIAIDNKDADVKLTDELDREGWIQQELTAPSLTSEQSSTITIRVQDADGHETKQSTKITVEPPKGTSPPH